jgi:hypothetical protein
MILLYDPAKAGPYMTVYKDSDDPTLFYYIPAFGELRTFPDGRLAFGAVLFKKKPGDPNGGFSLYNMGVTGVTPSKELAKAQSELQASVGHNVVIQPVPALDVSLSPITSGIYRSVKCQAKGGNIYTDLAASFTLDDTLEPEMAHFFQTGVGWTGEIDFTVRTKKTSFQWLIRANWHRIQEHFRAETSVKYWFVSANLSYETQKLIENDTLHIEISGGTPSQKEKIYSFAEKIAARLFVPTLSPTPLPDHPTGAALCFSLNYSKVEEDRSSEWTGKESDFEDKQMGIAVYVRDVPKEYFQGFDNNPVALDPEVEDTHQQAGYIVPKSVSSRRPDARAEVKRGRPRR